MAKVPQYLIDEATRRGIVEGAVIRSAMPIDETVAIVPAHDKWKPGAASKGDVHFHEPLHCYILENGKWATVITPAPAPEGLEEGDAVECGPAMRAAIVELAKELGLMCSLLLHPSLPHLVWHGFRIGSITKQGVEARIWHAPEAFIAKMRVTVSQSKPIIIDGHRVEWMHGHIRVGCQRIPNNIVRAIAANLIEIDAKES